MLLSPSHISPSPSNAAATARPGIAMPHIEVPKTEVASLPLVIGIPATHADATTNGMPVRPKSQNLTPQ